MNEESIKREVLVTSAEFKRFWQEKGPFAYALTSNQFPPVLLEPEEWIFSHDIQALLKDLMQFDQRKMKFVKAPFNPENKSTLRPENLSPWKINHFPEEWNACACDLFTPEGHLTLTVLDQIAPPGTELSPGRVEQAFFHCLETQMDNLGYFLFLPRGGSKYAAVQSYLAEWEADEREAGLLP